MIYKLPPTFYYDHISRDLPAGKLVRETKTSAFVDLDGADYVELLSDAEFYWGQWQAGSFERDMFGVCSSARATVLALQKQGTPCCPKCGMAEHKPDRFCDTNPVHKEDTSMATATRTRSTRRHVVTGATRKQTQRVTAKEQGFPACYLGPTGNFKPGYDARAKSDLRAAVAGERTGAELHRFTKQTAQKLLAARGW